MSARHADERSFNAIGWLALGLGGGGPIAAVAVAHACLHSDRCLPPRSVGDVLAFVLPAFLMFAFGTLLAGYGILAALGRARISADGITVFGCAGRTVVAWDDVSAVYGAIPLRANGVPINRGTCRLQLKDGRRVRVPDAVGHFEILADRLHEAVLGRLWRAAERTLRRGDELEFGPVTLRVNGIDGGGRFVPWRSFGGFAFPNGFFRASVVQFIAAGEARPWLTLPYSQLPNAHMFLLLARTFARAAGTEAHCLSGPGRLTFPPLAEPLTDAPKPAPEPASAAPDPGPGPSRAAGGAPPPPAPRPAIAPSRHANTWRSLLLHSKGLPAVCTFSVGMSVAVLIYFLVIGLGASKPWFEPVYVMAILAAGFALCAYLTGRGQLMEIVVSDAGLILARPGRTTRRAWDEIDKVYIEERRVNRQRIARCHIVFTDGRTLKVDVGLSGYDAFLRSVERAVTTVRLSAARRALAAGSEVSFGPVWLTPTGIGIDRKWTTWRDAERIYIGNGHLVVRQQSARTYQHPLMDIPNYSVLLNLIHDQVGKRLEGCG